MVKQDYSKQRGVYILKIIVYKMSFFSEEFYDFNANNFFEFTPIEKTFFEPLYQQKYDITNHNIICRYLKIKQRRICKGNLKK